MNSGPLGALLPNDAAWRARLELEILDEDGRSRLGARRHVGPLRIQRPFYPEGDAPLHLYLLHPPGGLVAGDELEIAVHVRERARALITTPAAQKLYRSEGLQSRQRNLLRVESAGCLEWLPAETIVFDGARSMQQTKVELSPGAACIAWDVGCLGRPASELHFARGELRQSFEIWREREPLLVERTSVAGGSELLTEAFGYAGFSTYGNLYAVPASARVCAELVTTLRDRLEPKEGTQFAVTSLGSVLVVRVLGVGIERVRRVLVGAWQLLRPVVCGRVAHVPRIWAT